MKIKSFRVAGYKNLVSPVSLEGLDTRSVIVIHGLNNVGKSNLLEALQLPFLLMRLSDPLPFGSTQPLQGKPTELGHTPTECFTLGKPTPIEIDLVLTFRQEELERRGLPAHASELALGVRIEGHPGPITWGISSFRFADGLDAAGASDENPVFEALRSLTATPPIFVSPFETTRGFAQAFAKDVPTRFALLDAHAPRGRHEWARDLALALYDAKESSDPREYLRWDAFVRICHEFDDVLGGAEPVVTYDRAQGRATLYLQSKAGRLPAHLLGTGVQQLLAIVGRMLVSKADVVALEEPETSVAPGLHARVREALVRMTTDPDGLTQVFLTSHSPWFDTGGEDFVAVVGTKDGPAVQWRRAADVGQFTQSEMALPPPGRAPLSYVTGEGYVALPPFVRDHLGVAHGGGVVFETAPEGRITMLSSERALADFGEDEEDARDAG